MPWISLQPSVHTWRWYCECGHEASVFHLDFLVNSLCRSLGWGLTKVGAWDTVLWPGTFHAWSGGTLHPEPPRSSIVGATAFPPEWDSDGTNFMFWSTEQMLLWPYQLLRTFHFPWPSRGGHHAFSEPFHFQLPIHQVVSPGMMSAPLLGSP